MLTATRSSQSVSGASAASPIRMSPALFTNMSSRPSSPTVAATAAATCSASVTSAGIASAVPPAASISAPSSCESVGTARQQGDRRALRGHRASGRGADTAACAGDQRHGARQCGSSLRVTFLRQFREHVVIVLTEVGGAAFDPRRVRATSATTAPGRGADPRAWSDDEPVQAALPTAIRRR